MTIQAISSSAPSRQAEFAIALPQEQQQDSTKKPEAPAQDQTQRPAEKIKASEVSKKSPDGILAAIGRDTNMDFNKTLSDLRNRRAELRTRLKSYHDQAKAIINPLKESAAQSLFHKSFSKLTKAQKTTVGSTAMDLANMNIAYQDLRGKIAEASSEFNRVIFEIASIVGPIDGGNNDYYHESNGPPFLIEYMPPLFFYPGYRNSNYNMVITPPIVAALLPPTTASRRENPVTPVFPPAQPRDPSPPGFSAGPPQTARETRTRLPDNASKRKSGLCRQASQFPSPTPRPLFPPRRPARRAPPPCPRKSSIRSFTGGMPLSP